MSDPTAPGQPGDSDPDGAAPPSNDSVGASDATTGPPVPPAAVPVTPDAQPTQTYPPVDDAPATEAYPAAGNDDPTQAYPAGGYPGAPEQYPGQPGYDGATAAGTGVAAGYGGAPGGPVGPGTATKDTRPRNLAIAALIAAVVGALLTLGGFIPVPGVSTVLVVIGGILLLVGFVLSLIALIGKKQGGKPLSITALIVSIIGGIVFFFALIASLLWLGLAAAIEDGDLDDPAPTSSALPSQEASEAPSATPSEEATPGETPSESAPGATGTYDEAAYLAAVRPEFVAILQEIQPGITEAEVAEIYPDEALISIGQSFAALVEVGGLEAGRQSFVESTVSSSNGAITEDQANRLFDTVSNAAGAYLVQ